MADTDTTADAPRIMKIPVSKGKGTIDVDLRRIPDAVYEEALLQGLKQILGRGASKITKAAFKTEAEYHAAGMAKAAEQLEMAYAGKTKTSGGKSAEKVTGEVMTEARRLAKGLVKEEMKKHKIKVSHVEASEITKAANALLNTDKGAAIIAQAKANIDARKAAVTDEAGLGIDVGAIPVSAKKVAAAEKAAAEKKAEAAARKAGNDGVTDKRSAKAKAPPAKAKPAPEATA